MKVKRFFLVLLAVVLPFSYLGVLSTSVLAAIENFGGWAETDPNSRVAVTSSRVTWTDLTRDEDAYVYKDKGADYFSGNFEIQFTHKSIDGATDSSVVSIWAVANTVDDLIGIDTANGSALAVYVGNAVGSTKIDFGMEELDSGTAYYSSTYRGDYGTNYYITVKRNEAVGAYGTLYCYIYSDSARTNLLSTLSRSLHSSRKDFRYIYALQSWDTGEAVITHSGYNEDVEIVSVTVSSPSVTTIAATDVDYDADNDYFIATISGNITDDGGEPCLVGFYLRIQGVGAEWTQALLSGYYGEGDTLFNIQLDELEAETIYEYKAYVSNSANTTYGNTLTFTTSFYIGLPSVTTLGYPLTLGTDNATLYGYIVADGSSNCTGWIQYRQQDSGDNWTASSNTTGLISGDTFSAVVGSLMETWIYDFRAAAMNDSGTSYGGIADFQILPSLTTPEVDTLPATLVTSDTAWIHGELIDDGGTDCWLYFEWRIAGDTVWLETNQTIASSNTTFLHQLTGLTPLENYEYRAVASNYNVSSGDGYVAYGETLSFAPYAVIGTPVIITRGAVYIDDVSVAVTGGVQYDGGSGVAVWFQYKLIDDTTWLETDKTYSVTTGYEVQHLLHPLEYNKTYQYRALGENVYAVGYGSIVTFDMLPDLPVPDSDETITSVANLISQIRANLGLIGIMGTWAFMGLVLLIVALLFGIPFAVTANPMGKTAIGFTWLLATIAVVGGFIFTGELGVWPLIVLVGGVVVLIMITLSIKLSGGSANG